MTAIIRPIGQLKSFFDNQPTVIVEAGCPVREILVRLQIQPDLVAGVVVNGNLQSKDYTLQEDDDVKLFAVMSGG